MNAFVIREGLGFSKRNDERGTSRRKWLPLGTLILIALASEAPVSFAGETSSKRLWFAPPTFQSIEHGSRELVSLTKSPQAWGGGLAHVKVFKLYIFAVGGYSDETLLALFSFLSANKIDLALEAPPLTLTDDHHCGWATEGYIFPQRLAFFIDRIRLLGGNLKYFAMDEPLFYGHDLRRDSKNHACEASIEAVAKDAAMNLEIVRSRFPRVLIGDIEPLGMLSDGDLAGELTRWAESFSKAAGYSLSFFHIDVLFDNDTEKALRIAKFTLDSLEIPAGIIFNGSPAANTDQEWVQSAIVRARKVNSLELGRFDVIVQDWNPFPRTFLPESSEATLTYFLRIALTSEVLEAPPVPLFLVHGVANGACRSLVTRNEYQSLKSLQTRDSIRIEVHPEMIGGSKMAALHRLHSSTRPDRDLGADVDVLITTSSEERKQSVLRGYVPDFLLGYALLPSSDAGKPLWRAYNPALRCHLYTIFEDEYNALPPSVWRLDGIVARFPFY